MCYNFKSQINSNWWEIHLAHGPLTYESSVYQMSILTWAMYQYVNISSWKYTICSGQVGTVEVSEGEAVCFLMSVAWHAYTVPSVTLQHDVIAREKKQNPDSLINFRHKLDRGFYDFKRWFLTSDAITYCFSSSVPVQFIFFSTSSSAHYSI